jgi:hypothetical protein
MLIPTQPVKSFRTVPRLNDVTKFVEGTLATTVSVAAFDGVEPALLLTTQRYWAPVWARVVTGVV